MGIRNYYLEINTRRYQDTTNSVGIRLIRAEKTPPNPKETSVVVDISAFLADGELVCESTFSMCYGFLIAKTLKRLLSRKPVLVPWVITGVPVEVSDYWEVWDAPDSM